MWNKKSIQKIQIDDDAYVVVENLRHFLMPFNTTEPLWFGCRLNNILKNGYMHGGAGIVLSKEALGRLVLQVIKPNPFE